MARIIFRQVLDYSPTPEDRRNRPGFEKFVEKLQKAGWVDFHDKVVVPFHYQCEGVDRGFWGGSYIEYRAISGCGGEENVSSL